MTCPASISGDCPEMHEGFAPCWDECERLAECAPCWDCAPCRLAGRPHAIARAAGSRPDELIP